MYLLGLVLFLIIPLLYVSVSNIETGYSTQKSQDVLVDLTSSADRIAGLGPGNQETIEINSPKRQQTITVNQQSIDIQSPNQDYTSNTKSNLITGQVVLAKGINKIPVQATESGSVLIGTIFDSPTLTTIAPSSFPATSLPRTLTLTGTNFYTGAQVLAAQSTNPTNTYTGATQTTQNYQTITYTFPALNQSIPLPVVIYIKIRNSEGGTSQEQTFTIT